MNEVDFAELISQFGILGALLWMLNRISSGEYVPRQYYEREKKRADDLEAMIYSRVIPLIDKSVEAVKAGK